MSTALARQMPPVQHARINGVDMAYYEVGPRGQGTPIVFCHGFPELAFSWRHQLRACEAAGIKGVKVSDQMLRDLWQKFAFLTALSSVTGSTRQSIGPTPAAR